MANPDDWKELINRWSLVNHQKGDPKLDALAAIYEKIDEPPTDQLFWIDRGRWRADTTYPRNHMVEENGWLMVSNKETMDYPAPAPVGDRQTTLPDISPGFATETELAVIETGHVYTLSKSGVIRNVRIWVPEVGPTITHRLIVTDITDPTNEVEIISTLLPDLVPGTWNTLLTAGDLLAVGTVARLELITIESADSTIITGAWRYDGTSQQAAPGAQGWNTNNQSTLLRIHKTDISSNDRGAELLTLDTGSTIRFEQQGNPSAFTEYLITSDANDQGAYVDWGVTVTGSGAAIPTSAITDGTFESPVPQPAEYVEIGSYWPSNPQSFVTVTGFKQYDGVPQPAADDNAYGIDIEFFEYQTSPDWDFASSANVTAPDDTGSGGIVSALVAASLVSQAPVGTDNPAQIEFGAPQDNALVSIDASGTATIKVNGTYNIRVLLAVSRTFAAGISYFFVRGLVNGQQLGNPVAAIMTDDDMTIPLEYTFAGELSAGDEISFEMYRDSAGVNNGGLDAVPSAIGWGNSASASLRINRFT